MVPLSAPSPCCRGGFDLRRLCVVGTCSPTAHICWQRHLTQQPLLLLDDGTLLEVQVQQGVQVRLGGGRQAASWTPELVGFWAAALGH